MVKGYNFEVPIYNVWQNFTQVCAQSEAHLIYMYSLIEQNDLSDYSDLPVDSFPMYLSDIKNDNHKKPIKIEVIDKLIARSFEEIFNGLVYSLQDIQLFIEAQKLQANSKLNPILGIEKLEEEINKIRRKAEKTIITQLLKNIQTELNIELKYKEEIETLNTLRIVLTHRNGIVSTIDTNSDKKLPVKYIGIDLHRIDEGGETKFTAENKNRLNQKGGLLKLSLNAKEISFVSSDKVKLNFNQWNDFRLTLLTFLSTLIHDLPIPQEIKDTVPTKIEANIAFREQEA